MRGNGPEPPVGSWVIASYSDCPDRLHWRRNERWWVDAHGCKHSWDELVDPIDALEPPEDV